jgi:hypothetical protein
VARFIILGPQGHLVGRANTLTIGWKLGVLVREYGSVRVSFDQSPAPVVKPITMYDSTDVTQIPAVAVAVAGYVNGRWPTYPTLVKQFPKAHVLSIDVTGNAEADCLDIEQGDATPAVAPFWVARQQARGVKRPVLYCSLSEAQNVLAAMQAKMFARSSYRLWTAHYTGKPHRCNAGCGFDFLGEADATQWTDKALGRTLDASLCAPGFFT